MKNRIITIENGIVSVPALSEVRMTIGEIAELFGIYYQTAKKCIRTIEKVLVAGGDYTMGSTVEGMTVYPDYYGLEMIIAVAFRVQSQYAAAFRNWLIRKLTKSEIPEMLIMAIQNPVLN